MTNVIGLQCTQCGRKHSVAETEYICVSCVGNLEVLYDYDFVGRSLTKASLSADRNFTMWRYRALLPIEPSSPVPQLTIGWTPIYDSKLLAGELGVSAVLIKDDGRNPTASFKDRPSALAAVKARERQAPVITTASSGNAGSALAGVCASIGQRSVIFVPATAPSAKIAQLLVYGAVVVLVEGSYDQVVTLCIEASKHFGWYQRSTGYNPYTREGKKTAALEIAEQLDWNPPDKVFVAVGDGNIISGLWKGFRDLQALGFIDRAPKLVAVQAEGAAAIVNAVNGDGIVRPVPAHTIADSINVGYPNDGAMAVRAIKESGGAALTVSDTEISAAMIRLARSTGVFCEPAAAAAFAGLLKQQQSGALDREERVLVLVTGNGLKDIDAARRAVSEPIRIQPDMEDLVRNLPSDLRKT